MVHVEMIGQAVKCLLGNLLFIDHDGIVEVTTLDQAGLEQWLDFAHEHESTGRSDLLREILHVIQRSELTVDELRFEGDHRRDGELLIGENDDGRTRLVIAEFNLLLDDIEVLLCILLLDTHAADALHIFN